MLPPRVSNAAQGSSCGVNRDTSASCSSETASQSSIVKRALPVMLLPELAPGPSSTGDFLPRKKRLRLSRTADVALGGGGSRHGKYEEAGNTVIEIDSD